MSEQSTQELTHPVTGTDAREGLQRSNRRLLEVAAAAERRAQLAEDSMRSAWRVSFSSRSGQPSSHSSRETT